MSNKIFLNYSLFVSVKVLYGIIDIMAKEEPNYGRIRIKDLPNTRRGKHFDLLNKILSDLGSLPSGSAITIPMKEIEGIGVANLRSAVNRTTRAKGLKVETQSDQDFFYVWKA
jgi:hypothetical protein